jgi:two-component system chemotaxis response regulator CheY
MTHPALDTEAQLNSKAAMNKLVLTVDDSAAIREMLAYVLKSAGHKVVEAEDGMDGLQKALANAFDLVITDQSMPKMDGITLVKALRALPQYKTTPILLLTTESSDAMKDEGRLAGATGWLVKPFDPNKLIEVVQKVTR